MTQTKEQSPGLFVAARFIPTPLTVSPEAQAFLSSSFSMSALPDPDRQDLAAWRMHVKQGNTALTEMSAAFATKHPGDILTHRLSATEVFEVISNSIAADNEQKALLYIHGGGFTVGGGIAAAYMALPIASLLRTKVFSVNYRMPPDYPFPAGLEDCLEAYRLLLKQYKPQDIAVYGSSAGGGLAASVVLKARDIGLPLPAACVLATPEADLTESGDTFETNDTIDIVLSHRLSQSIALYAAGHNLRDPYLSPVFGDFSRGFPATLLTSGTRDLFLSNTVILHRALRRAGVTAELHVFEAMPHGGFFGAPEDQEVLLEHTRFVEKHLGLMKTVSCEEPRASLQQQSPQKRA